MPLPPVNFDSRPDTQGQTTRLVIDPDAATIKSVMLLKAGAQPALNLQTSVISLFTIRFSKFSLTNNKRLPEAIEYQVKQAAQCTVNQGAGTLTLTYNQVAASAPGYDSIKVVLTFSAAADASGHQGESIDSGWIELDIQYTYPSQVSGDNQVAWETELIYPEISFDPAAVKGYLLLDPTGILKDFLTFSLQEISNLMLVQFAALYLLGRSNAGINNATGIALSATDEQGHTKYLRYRPSANDRSLAFRLALPIHLKTINTVANCYVRPNAYTLSGGGADNDKGFSGAQMHYRIRAFQVEGAKKDVPVDWHDVVNIYRNWVKGKRPSFYRKHISRPTESFGGSMSPHTVVANYGLDAHIDPSVVDPKFPDLRKWLEIHPIVMDGSADMPGNHPYKPDKNESLQDILVRIKERFNVPGMRLEAQIWGFEMASYYQFAGAFPPSTNVITGKGRKFQRAMEELVSKGVLPCLTTDVLNTNFERYRFRGHMIKDGNRWREAIPHEFPAAIKAATCANPPHVVAKREFISSACPEAVTLTESSRIADDGNRQIRYESLTRFYNVQGRHICPTRAIEDLYNDLWLRDNLLAWGVKLVEFMKHHSSRFSCYDKSHRHVEPPEAGLPYDNVIGRGPWYIKRLQRMLGRVQDLGQQKVGDDFVLTNEHQFPETLVPYFDEFYDYDFSSLNLYSRDMRSLPLLEDKGAERRVPVFRYVYNELVSMKMNLADAEPHLHPGYREKRKNSRSVPPSYMLAPARDDEDAAALKYRVWQRECTNYFAANYEITSHGIAPTDYPTNSGPGVAPGTYTFNHCIQSVFNLRSYIFRYGMAAVLGERIYILSTLMEEPSDYNAEAVNMAVRAAHMQMRFKAFFRGGYMLGQTQITSGNKSVWAWRVYRRSFFDVEPLVKAIYSPDEINGKPPTDGALAIPPTRLSIMDVISRAIDKQILVPLGKYDYRPQPPSKPDENPPLAIEITTDVIQHMIWQRGQGQGRRTLYAFANVGNSDRRVNFLYARGLEDAQPWTRTVFTFKGDADGAPGSAKEVMAGVSETITIPARSCASILIFK